MDIQEKLKEIKKVNAESKRLYVKIEGLQSGHDVLLNKHDVLWDELYPLLVKSSGLEVYSNVTYKGVIGYIVEIRMNARYELIVDIDNADGVVGRSAPISEVSKGWIE